MPYSIKTFYLVVLACFIGSESCFCAFLSRVEPYDCALRTLNKNTYQKEQLGFLCMRKIKQPTAIFATGCSVLKILLFIYNAFTIL